MAVASHRTAPAQVRYGLIGSGMMGQEHIRNLALIDGASIAALCDPDEDMRGAAALLAGPDVAQFTDHRTLLSQGGLDALVIASPNHTHKDILMDVLASDLPLLVEKPLCTTLADCREVTQAAQGRSAPVWVAMEYRYMPPVARLIEEVEGGTAGRVAMLSIREHRYPFLAKVSGWNRLARNTGGTMVEKCCHFFDLMRLIVRSEPARLFASGGQDVNHLDELVNGEPADMVDNAIVTVEFRSGARAVLELCMFAEGSPFQEQIAAIGSEAKVEARVPGPDRFRGDAPPRHAEIEVAPRGGHAPRCEPVSVDPAILHAGDHHGSTFYQHKAFNALVREGGVPAVTLEDGLMAVAMGQAAEESINTGRIVEFDAFLKC